MKNIIFYIYITILMPIVLLGFVYYSVRKSFKIGEEMAIEYGKKMS